MVRAKKTVDSVKQAEIHALLEKIKVKFNEDKHELEIAKRRFSTVYVEEILKELEDSVPQNVLDMKAKDFAHFVKQLGPSDSECHPNNFGSDLQTPLQSRRFNKFKSITTPSGVSVQIPSLITPRVDGAVLRSRMSRQGEVLFSVNGTPVTISDDQQIDLTDAKDQAKIVQELLQRDETEMSPATQKIMKQLRAVYFKHAEKIQNVQGKKE